MSRLNSFEVIIALLFIVFGFLLLAGNLGLFVFNWSMIWALMLIFLGGWFIWRAFQPQPFVSQPGAAYGFGDYRPDLAGKEIRKESFSHGFGDFDLDLTRVVFPDGTNSVRASHGFGELKVILPRDLAVRVKANAGMGEVGVLGQRADGFAPTLTFQSDDYATAARKLDLEVSVGFGDAKVARG